MMPCARKEQLYGGHALSMLASFRLDGNSLPSSALWVE